MHKNKILFVIVATDMYAALGLRLINNFINYYVGDSEIYFKFISNYDPREYIDYENIIFVEENSNMGFVYGTTRKIYNIKTESKEFDYVYYIDADTKIDKNFDDSSFIGDLVALKHMLNYQNDINLLQFEKNKESSAYFDTSNVSDLLYYHACFYGGTSENMNMLSEANIEMYESDFSKGILAVWEDETYLNKFFNTIKRPTRIIEQDELFFISGDKGGTSNHISGKNAKLFNGRHDLMENILDSFKNNKNSIWGIYDNMYLSLGEKE